jgi:IclR family transcriptional regulator, acetate operon repressor
MAERLDAAVGTQVPPDDAPIGARGQAVVHRTMQVLEAFALKPAWGVRELASHLAVSKSGLHRTLQEMLAEGLLRIDDSQSYVLGGKMLKLASGLIYSVDLNRMAHASLVNCRSETGETAVLVSYDEGRQQIIAIDCLETGHAVQFSWGGLREWTDLHLSASGLAVMAFLPAEDQARYFHRERIDNHGNVVILISLKPQLRKIRATGWAVSHGMRVPGTSGVAAPILNARGHVVGGLVIAWPNRAEQTDATRIGRLCASEASATSERLGWTGRSN